MNNRPNPRNRDGIDPNMTNGASCMLVFGILFGLFLTCFEIFAPFMVLILASSVTTEMKITTLFDSLSYYYYLLYFLMASCFLLFACFALQFYHTFKKKVHILRHIANTIFMILSIMVAIESSKSKENKFRLYLANNWNTLEVARQFEEQFNCNNLSFMNTTQSVFCDKQINIEIDAVYGKGQSISGWFGTFLSIISLYYIVSFVMVQIMNNSNTNF